MKLYPTPSIFFLIWLACIVTIFYFGFRNLPHTDLFPNHFHTSFANWDGGHYLGIADGGYDAIYQYAFFPLYPLVVGLIGQILHSYLYAGILVSILSSFLAVNLLFQLVAIEFNRQTALNAVMAILFFPTAFYLTTVYTEGLFLMLTLASFLFARKDNLFAATVFASLASATRFAGLGVVMGFWVYLYLHKKLNIRNWFVFLAPLGFILYCIYLWNMTGNPLYFVQAESHWHREVVFPGKAVLGGLFHLLNPNYILENFSGFLDIVFTIFAVVMVLKLIKKLPLDIVVFSIFSLCLPLFSPTLLAMPRYILTIFPIFIMISLVKNKYFKFAYQLIGTLLLAGFSILFIAGYWVT